MYSLEQRKIAVETFIEFGRSYADTIAELGYPNRHSLYNWWGDYRECGEVRPGKPTREPKLAPEMKRVAAGHCLGHGRGPARTMRAPGHPKGGERPASWTGGPAPGQRKGGPAAEPRRGDVPPKEKIRAVAEPGGRDGTAAEYAGADSVHNCPRRLQAGRFRPRRAARSHPAPTAIVPAGATYAGTRGKGLCLAPSAGTFGDRRNAYYGASSFKVSIFCMVSPMVWAPSAINSARWPYAPA